MKNNRRVAVRLDVYTYILTITFVILKLCRVITWSWVWVLSPLWIGFLIFLIAFFIAYIVIGRNTE